VNFAKLGLAGVSASHSNFIAKVQARAARLKRKEPPPLRSKGGGILAQRPMYKFLVQPMPTVVTPPNLSAHKPAGDRASRHKDPRQMPSRRPRLEPVQSQYPAVDHCEANGSHRAPPWLNRRDTAILLEEGPATVVNKVPLFSLICDHCDIFTAARRNTGCTAPLSRRSPSDRSRPREAKNL
jgi:hypothetical protein